MERSVAVKKLAKMIGKKFGYQINAKAPTREEREAAKAALTEATKARNEAGELMKKRSEELLAADAEYQRLRAAYSVARKEADQLMGVSHSYKITVGESNSMFFHVMAQGDSWEDVIEKVKKAKPGF